MRRLGGTPPEVLETPELVDFFLPLLRSDLRLLESYAARREPALNCPLFVLAAKDDPECSLAAAAAWQAKAAAGFSLTEMEGGHFFLNSKRDDVMARLKTIVAEALE